MPRSLFDGRKKLNESVSRKLASARTVLLFLDFDGTLAPIRKTPSRAELPQRTRKILVELVRRSDCIVGIATGRSRADIVRKVGLRRLFLITNHGFEISVGGNRWIHPAARRARPQLTACFRELRKSLRDVRGILIEHKGYTLSVHVRNVSKEGALVVKETVANLLHRFSDHLKSTAGKKVLEIRPRVVWDKGHAALRVLQSLKRSTSPVVIYIGDDTTDEDAFRLLPRTAVTIVVGAHTTGALYRVKNPGEVLRFLRSVNRIRLNGGHT